MVQSERETPKVTHHELEQSLKQQIIANRGLEVKLARLQLQLLEKEAQLEELHQRREEATLEVVRAKARLQSLGGKAEAASNLAEAEIAMKALKSSSGEAGQARHAAKAEELLRMGAQEFKKENYGGALYLTLQAKSLIRKTRERSPGKAKRRLLPGETVFALPVPLQAQTNSNVRNGPGLQFKVVATLKRGARVVGHSYKGEWVRVRDEKGRDGWILYELLDGR